MSETTSPKARRSPKAKAALAATAAISPQAAVAPDPSAPVEARPGLAAAPPPEPVGAPREEAAPMAAAALAGSAEAGAKVLADLLAPEHRAAVDTLSMNLARAAMTAQAAIAEAAMKQASKGSPVGLVDPFHVSSAWGEVMSSLAAHPEKLMRAQADLYGRYVELWRSAAQKAAGESAAPVAAPARGDKRFSDPDWSNPMFDLVKQSYLITSTWLADLVSAADDVEPMTRRRVEFVTRMLTDAFSPSNFLLSNPAALREAAETRGESLLRGMRNFAADLERGGGQLAISQTDFDQFKVGENVATAPGKAIFQNDLIQLLQFSPSTETVRERPILIFPPWINKFYILDLRPENSMIRWLSSQGFTVFLTSWVNPDARLATRTFEDYMNEGVYAAVDAALRQSGASQLNAVGYCIGGTLLSCALAHMAARGDERVGSATFFAAQQDFSEAGDLQIFTNDAWLKDLEARMDAGGGVLPGQAMADTFNVLRANDLIWSYFVNNYLMGKDPKPFDLLFWNADQTRMPKTLHLYYLRKFYMENALARGELELGGVRLDLGAVRIPVFVQSSREDHIAPARSVYKGARLFGGPTRFTLAGSGHIAGVINAPAARKYQYWINEALPPTLEEWQAGSVEHPGSWWPAWAAWLDERSGQSVPARDPAAGPLPPIEDAPGSFVKVRS